MLAESGSLGLRWSAVERTERPRETVSVQTAYGLIPVKVAQGDGLAPQCHPELEACRAGAVERGAPTRVVVPAALGAWWVGRE